MKHTITLLVLALALTLSACAPKLEGVYAHQGTAFKFASDGQVAVLLASMPNSGAAGTYKIQGELIRLNLSNGSSYELKKDADGWRDTRNNELYSTVSEQEFWSRGKPDKPATIGNEKTF